jgi:cysteine-rich repeat protein
MVMKRSIYAVLPLALSACLSRRIDDLIAGQEVTEAGSSGASSTTGSSSGSSSDGSSGSSEATTAGSGEASVGETSSSGSSGSETEDSASTGVTTTTGGPAVCGDGVVDEEEECDDENGVLNDGCSECTRDIRVFVSSVTYKAGDLMSPHLADARCFNRADDAGLANPLQFKAWLSSSTEDARDRFDRTRRGRLVMINGLVLAAGWPELLAGALENPLEVTETSETYHGPVWTGTKSDGTAADSGHCLDWSVSFTSESAYYGYSDEISFEWTLADQIDNPAPCIAPLAIYCFDSF